MAAIDYQYITPRYIGRFYRQNDGMHVYVHGCGTGGVVAKEAVVCACVGDVNEFAIG